MTRSRTTRTHHHGDNRLTFGCAACIDDMRFDQAVAAIADSSTSELIRRCAQWSRYARKTGYVVEPRRVIAAVRLELWRRRIADEAHGGGAA
jgi:hypothetical protein